ncbi:MAG: bacillithiol biosynthesis cysteine-adding enzyme BshC [Rubricoccaceae bacterium]
MTPSAVRQLDPEALGGSALSTAYLRRHPDALAFYRWDWGNPEHRAAAAAEAAARSIDRNALAGILAEQNRAWGASGTALTRTDILRQPDSVAVVTGQQLGLFAGPLYSIYKALSAVRYAEQIEAETGRPAVAVFWLAGEDHDFEEVQSTVFTDGPDVRRVRYDTDEVGGPVGRMTLDADALATTLRQLEAALPDGPHRDEVLELVTACYRPGVTMRDAFARLLRRLAPGLVLMSVDDPRLKALAAPVFEKEVAGWDDTQAALEDVSRQLDEADFHAQVTPMPVNLFAFTDDGLRLPIDPEGEGFRLRGSDALSVDELANWARDAPERLSPNVVLRPLVQDVLLPTVAYVAGPGEAAYFAQLKPVYERFGVAMPIIWPRLSLTVVEPSVAKILDRYDLDLPDLSGDLHALWRRLALDASETDLEAAFSDARETLDGLAISLQGPITATSSTLESALGAAQAKMTKALDRLETKTVRVEKRTHDDVRARLERAQAALWPGGSLQERALSPLQFAVLHGLDVFLDLVGAVDLDPSAHHVVWA